VKKVKINRGMFFLSAIAELATDECEKDKAPKPCAQEGLLRRIPPKKWRDHVLARRALYSTCTEINGGKNRKGGTKNES
jgi:hypothetical protein